MTEKFELEIDTPTQLVPLDTDRFYAVSDVSDTRHGNNHYLLQIDDAGTITNLSGDDGQGVEEGVEVIYPHNFKEAFGAPAEELGKNFIALERGDSELLFFIEWNNA